MSQDISAARRETGDEFLPRFDDRGLLTAVVLHADTRAPLMVAHMNAEALDATRATGEAHFWSRSRQSLWRKGEASGHVLAVESVLVDCDQDALVLLCRPAGPACHTGAPSCFYRELTADGLAPVS